MTKYIAIIGDMPSIHTGFAKVTDHIVDAVILGFKPLVILQKP